MKHKSFTWRDRVVKLQPTNARNKIEVEFDTILLELKREAARETVLLGLQDKSIEIDIRFGEIYHMCTDSEWSELKKLIGFSEDDGK
ncbi:hypothetical protein KQH82_05525 [bacterium]|nr:hypothetical protein [bacterium]